MQIRLLYFGGCPHYQEAAELLGGILQELGILARLELVEVKDEPTAQLLGFLGSPTIQIDGLDIETGRQESAPMFGCRMYMTTKGRTGVPSRELIVSALKRNLEESRYDGVRRGPGLPGLEPLRRPLQVHQGGTPAQRTPQRVVALESTRRRARWRCLDAARKTRWGTDVLGNCVIQCLSCQGVKIVQVKE